MGELDAELGGADRPRMVDDALHRLFVGVGSEARAAGGDAAAQFNAGRLDDEQGGAGIGEHADMGHVPVGHRAVVGRILAHGRDDDAVRKLDAGELDRREQVTGHGNSGV
jgi:hypothetical protein